MVIQGENPYIENEMLESSRHESSVLLLLSGKGKKQ